MTKAGYTLHDLARNAQNRVIVAYALQKSRQAEEEGDGRWGCNALRPYSSFLMSTVSVLTREKKKSRTI